MIIVFLLVLNFISCGSDDISNVNDGYEPDEGSYSFTVNWPEDVSQSGERVVAGIAIDCEGSGIITVKAVMYDENNMLLSGGEWPCSLHSGQITGIPVGTNRRCVITALNASETVVYQGEDTGITITKGNVAYSSDIIMELVDNRSPAATITGPMNNSIFAPGDTVLFTGNGSDSEDGILNGDSLIWTSNLDGKIGTGETVSSSMLSEGAHFIILLVTDSDGATNTDTIKIIIGSPPVVEIISPTDGSMYTQGDMISFSGTALDNEDGSLGGDSLAWTSSSNGKIGTGESVSRSSLSPGTHQITFTATDSDGVTGSDTIQITIASKTPPMAEITDPPNNSTFIEGETIAFAGTGTDIEDDTFDDTQLVWTSNRNGRLGTGASLSTSDLSTGTHLVTFRVTDSDGENNSDTIVIVIKENTLPVAHISGPADYSTYLAGTPVSFNGTGTDGEDGVLTGASLVWTSNLDGWLGTGVVMSSSVLSSGTHAITLTVTDSVDASDMDRIHIVVEADLPPANNPPVAEITGPQNHSIYIEKETVSFSGSGTDAEDGTLTGTKLVWSSNRDGEIGTGNSLATSELSIGTHEITLSVTDGRGANDSARIEVIIEANMPPVAAITSPPDGSEYTEGAMVTLNGTGTDEEDGVLIEDSLVWTSNRDGDLGTDMALSTSALSIGLHSITLTVTDSHGASHSDTINISINENTPPVADITSPANNRTYIQGDQVTFSGTGTDSEDGTLSGDSLVWVSSINGRIGTGIAVLTSTLSLGKHKITLTATDSHGATSTDNINITIAANTSPVATITSPANGSKYKQGTTVSFSGTGTDTEDGTLSGTSLAWVSSLDGSLGTGTSVSSSTLSVGSHTITLTATDHHGASDFKTVQIEIYVNTPPVADISSPPDGSKYTQGTAVSFNGTGTDTQDMTLSGSSLSWNSSRDGNLGTGISVSSSSLTLGTHVITLTATDKDGATGSDTIQVIIEAPNSPPVAAIISPANGSTYAQGETVSFNGTGTDGEDGTLSGSSLEWTSNLDGRLGTGTSVSISTLSVGPHTIILSVTDSDGATDIDTIEITISTL